MSGFLARRRARMMGVAVLTAGSLVLAACGGGDSTSEAKAPPAAHGSGICDQPQEELDADPAYADLVKAAAAEGEVNWANGMTEEDAAIVTDAFEKAYPCIKVNFNRQIDDNTRQALFAEMQKGLFQVDVMDVSSSEIEDFQGAGLLHKVNWKEDFPDLLDIQVNNVVPELIAIGGQMKAGAFNTNEYKKEDLPTAWDGYLEPKWKNSGMVVDSKPKFLFQLTAAWGIDKTVEYAKSVAAQKPVFRRGQSETMALIAAGEIGLSIGLNWKDVLDHKDEGAPVDYVFIEPIPISMEQQAVMEGAPHMAAATLLLGWMGTKGNSFYDEVTDRGLALPGAGTETAKLVEGKELSVCDLACSLKEDDYSDVILPALGLE